MKLKQLEGLLGGLEQFTHPKAENSFVDVSNKVVADFGCGCGTLGVAAAFLSADTKGTWFWDFNEQSYPIEDSDEIKFRVQSVSYPLIPVEQPKESRHLPLCWLLTPAALGQRL